MNSELSLYDYWRIINRRKWAALLIFAVTTFSTLFYTHLQPVLYSSQAVIQIKPPASYSKIPGSDAGEYDSWNMVATEIRVLTSSEIAERAARRLGLAQRESATDYQPSAAGRRILSSYRAERLQDSNLISLSATTLNPEEASDILAAVIDAYSEYDLEFKSRQARKKLEDIGARKTEVESSLRSLERDKQRFLENNPQSGLGASLVNQLSDLETKRKELLEKYTPSHPDAQSLQSRIRALEERLGEIPAQELKLVRISRELRMQEELYTTLNREYEEAKLGLAAIVSFVSVVSRPLPEYTPVSPNRRLNLIVGMLLGAFLAVVVVFLLENLDVSISTIEDIESFLKLPVLGIIPHISSDRRMDNWLTQFFKKERYTIDAFRSALVVNRRYASGIIESYHTLRANIMSLLKARENPVLVISSAGAAEGKTLTAVNFSLAAAHSGLRTLLIDADLRRPAIHQIFGCPQTPGLSDALAGKAQWRDVMLESADFVMGGINFDQLMRFEGIENLKLLTSGTPVNNAIDLLDSADWPRLLTDMKNEFDLVIIDAPPVLLFVDSSMIARHTDGVVLVYKAGKIARGALKRAKEQVQGVNAAMIGVVLNGVRGSEMGRQYGSYSYDYKNYAPTQQA